MRLARGGSDFDDFVRHFVLEPQTYPGPVHQRFTDRGVMHAPRDVPFGGNALARSRTKLLEVAPRNIAAESRSCNVSVRRLATAPCSPSPAAASLASPTNP